MSAQLARVRAVFVEPGVGGAQATTMPRPLAPTIVVLCASGHSRAAAAAFGMATACVLGAPCAIVAAIGVVAATPSLGVRTPAAGRAAAALRARGHSASASGRLVWVPDRRAESPGWAAGSDPAGAAAAASADLGRAVAATGAPGVLAIPLVRTDTLDRVIAWHDGVVVICEPDATAAVADRIAESLATLGRPVACVSPPSRYAAALAELGLRAPASAVQAAEQLRLR